MLQLDGLSLHFICQDLQKKLSKGRVTKILQQGAKSFTFIVRSDKENYNLFVCTETNQAFLGLSEYKLSKEKENPSSFLLFLRKYLLGALLINIQAYQAERLIFIDFEAQTDLGDKKQLRLVVELMGRQSNLILLNEYGNILDSLIHVDSTQSKTREIMPARPYVLPPFQEKLSFIQTSTDKFKSWLEEQTVDNKHQYLSLLKENFLSTSPLLLRYVEEASQTLSLEDFKNFLLHFHQSCIQEHNICCVWGAKNQNLFHDLQNLTSPTQEDILDLIFQQTQTEVRFVPYALKNTDTLPQLIENEENFYLYFSFEYALTFMAKALTQKQEQKKLNQQKQNIQNYIQAERKQWLKKSKIYQEDLEKSKDFELEKLKGEMLLCQSYLAPLGTQEVYVENFYEVDTPKLLLKLNPALNAFQNAEHFFNRSKKNVQKYEIAKILIHFAKLQEDYLNSLEFHLLSSQDESSLQDLLTEIQISKENEMSLQDYIRSQHLEEIFEKNAKEESTSKKKSFNDRQEEKRKAKSVGKPAKKSKAFQKFIQKPSKTKGKEQKLQSNSKPHFFITTQGCYLEIGKNNLQNDALVQRKYPKSCIWLHIQNQAGPHAVLYSPHGETPNEQSLVEAAKMTAFFSLPPHEKIKKHERFEKMSVLYTDIKKVKKIKKGKPGLVQISDEQSFYLIPEYVLEELPNPADVL